MAARRKRHVLIDDEPWAKIKPMLLSREIDYGGNSPLC